jgi:uncharacterized protein
VSELDPIAFPLRVQPTGNTATCAPPEEVDALIRQLLFTDPGERLNRPTLGCGLIELIFDAISDELVAATQFQVQGALQQWLSTMVTVGAVTATRSGGELVVAVDYRLANASQWQTVVFRR